MKTIVKLKPDQAALVFSPKGGMQLVVPKQEGIETPQHIAFAMDLTFALQFDAFCHLVETFRERVAMTAAESELTH